MKKILIILLIFLSNNCKAHASKLNVYYSGFSFSNTYESNVEYSKYSSILIKEKIPDLNTDLGASWFAAKSNSEIVVRTCFKLPCITSANRLETNLFVY